MTNYDVPGVAREDEESRESRPINKQTETVGDRSESDTSKLPDKLQHGEILLFRDVSINGMRRSYQIVFDQSWMPFGYDPDGWKINYARTEYHPKRNNPILDFFLPSRPCITIVLSEVAEKSQYPPCERNNQFAHWLEQEIDPLSVKGRAFEDMILWRRHEAEGVPQLVEVKQCLKDDSDGHWEYVLTDMTHTRQWRYHEDDLADCFWNTGLYNRDEPKPVMDDQIREVFQRVCDHSFHTVHDSETKESAGEQCINCRMKRDVQGK